MEQQNQGRASTFGRSLMQYIANRLPFNTSQQMLDNINDINPKYKHFYNTGTDRDDLVSKYSISQSSPIDPRGDTISIDKNYHQFMYANVDHDKGKRIRDYRVMAAFAEVGDALDEICDEIINVDGNTNKFIDLKFKNDSDISSSKQTELQGEFQKFVTHFDLEKSGWEYFRRLLVDGELYFEHIIHEDHPEAGVLGVVSVPTESMDPIFDNVQNTLIKGFLLRKPIIDPKTKSVDKIEYIPFDKNQVTYIHSGNWNEDKTMRTPFIENCRRAYRQLSLIEDSIVIYRLVRAPERLVFNVDVGNMPPPKAEAYLKKLMHNYWSRKTYDKSQGGTVNAFNPQSMLDSFWFAKRAGSDGTNVQSLPGGSNLGELADLMYFVKKLYKSLRVPTNRLEVESRYEDGASILREELRFARFLIRLQQQFANGIKSSFIAHLKLKKIWDDYKLKEYYFDAAFNPPTSFYAVRDQQLFDLKFNNYSSLAQSEQISTTYMQKKHLEWSDKEIKQNREWLKNDAAFMWETSQILALGPKWREQMQQQADAAAAGAPGLGDAVGPGGGAPPLDAGGVPGGLPAGPEPGGDAGPATGVEGDAPAPVPVGGQETTALPS
jgi:hypothetical protein